MVVLDTTQIYIAMLMGRFYNKYCKLAFLFCFVYPSFLNNLALVFNSPTIYPVFFFFFRIRPLFVIPTDTLYSCYSCLAMLFINLHHNNVVIDCVDQGHAYLLVFRIAYDRWI